MIGGASATTGHAIAASFKRPIKSGVVCFRTVLEVCFDIRDSQLVDFVKTHRFESYSCG